jgi:hypothetical protein
MRPAAAVGDAARGGDDRRREPLYPPVDGDVIDLDAAFGQQFLDVAVGQSVAQIPPHRQHDDLGRKPEAREG